MLLAHNRSTDPHFNLALEEYALTEMTDEILLLWRNDRSVIIGKNQNAVEEIDADFLRENGVGLARRISGGGAVYHDLGNINYTMIRAMGDSDFSNYAKFTRPVCEFLATLGVHAEFQGRNDILLEGKKISGNAQAARNGRIMHHGTLLFDVDFSALSGALKPREIKIRSKGVKSVRSAVTNILPHLREQMAPEEFLDRIYRYFLRSVPGIVPYSLPEADIAAVNRLRDKKFATWDWNFGASPPYNYERVERFPSGIVELYLNVEKGILTGVCIRGDFFGMRDVAELERRLTGLRHDGAAVGQALREIPLDEYISGVTREDLLSLF